MIINYYDYNNIINPFLFNNDNNTSYYFIKNHSKNNYYVYHMFYHRGPKSPAKPHPMIHILENHPTIFFSIAFALLCLKS